MYGERRLLGDGLRKNQVGLRPSSSFPATCAYSIWSHFGPENRGKDVVLNSVRHFRLQYGSWNDDGE